MSGDALSFHTGVRLAEEPARLVGFTVAVRSLDAFATRVRAAGLAHVVVGDRIVLPPEAAFGSILSVVERATG
jgi:hypothetical protein